ncbi:MAG: Rrf2 family transcriptional regulator [Bdellovibrionales bacterium]|jgi:Rrf2 family protein|nr:Rrf2 family transcriptional regulator [Bdellovibrionales bacterium]
MLKINKKVEYGLMVLRYLGENNPKGLVSAREICDELKIPFDTTAKVMQALNHHNILSSVKGIKGGYSLEKDLNQITYMEMVEMIEGNTQASFCMTHKGLCGLHNSCNIIGPVERLNMKLTEFLYNLTIQDILFGETPIVQFKESP